MNRVLTKTIPVAKFNLSTRKSPAATLNPNLIKIIILAVVVVLAVAVYEFISIDPKYVGYALKIRTPKLIAMLIAASCIGAASLVFQSIIKNTIVTPCLLGMNSLYLFIHTGVVFILGSASFLVNNKNISFIIDLVVMSVVATGMYSYLFRKARYNMLYILLAGVVLSTFFSSITSGLIRVMDPNEYETLQNSLIAGFNRVNVDMIGISIVVILGTAVVLRKDLAQLNVIALGRNQAMSLGVEYDKTVRRLLLGVTVLIAVATAMVGPISFLGLIVANLARQLFTTYRHSYLVVGSVLIGVVILVVGQTLIENIFAFSVTIDVFINVGGGMYFLYLLLRSRNR